MLLFTENNDVSLHTVRKAAYELNTGIKTVSTDTQSSAVCIRTKKVSMGYPLWVRLFGTVVNFSPVNKSGLREIISDVVKTTLTKTKT